MIKMISCKIGASLKIAQAIGMIFIIGGAGIVTLPPAWQPMASAKQTMLRQIPGSTQI